MAIILDEKSLLSRRNSITNILSPLIPAGQRLASERHTPTDNKIFILSAFSSAATKREHYRNTFFKTISQEYLGNYFEFWDILKNDRWEMRSAYFHLYYNAKEVLALHCDPVMKKNEPHYKYRCGPHLHIPDQYTRFNKAHIALNLSNLNLIINSIQELNNAMKDGFEMIKDQFLS